MKQFSFRNLSHTQRRRSGIIAVVLLCLIFTVLFSTRVSANDGDFNRIRGYEQIMIRPGDTLDSLAKTYAGRYSHGSFTEYKDQIVRLNNLSTEYIQAGVYLLLPVGR